MLNQPNSDIPPKMTACLIDVSEHCSEEFLDRCGGKVYLSGFFDDSVNTYCCSLTPSVYVEGLEFVPERYPEDEELSEELNGELLENAAEGSYVNRSDIERMRKESPDNFEVLELTFDEDDDPSEVAREYLQGNPRF